jgi:hypothetical protein
VRHHRLTPVLAVRLVRTGCAARWPLLCRCSTVASAKVEFCDRVTPAVSAMSFYCCRVFLPTSCSTKCSRRRNQKSSSLTTFPPLFDIFTFIFCSLLCTSSATSNYFNF